MSFFLFCSVCCPKLGKSVNHDIGGRSKTRVAFVMHPISLSFISIIELVNFMKIFRVQGRREKREMTETLDAINYPNVSWTFF